MLSGGFPGRRVIAGERDKLVLAIAFGIAVGYAASLWLTFSSHIWILDAAGRPVVDDFVAFWSSGHLAHSGHAVAAYDPRLEHAAEVRTIGHDFPGTLGFTYPPLFLFVVSVLARLPYTFAFVLWCVATLALYSLCVGRLSGRHGGALMALAAPWVLTALTPGQNGFLTAGLMAACFFSLEERPALAGILLGLMSYKPQFGILFPLALAAGGYWRAFGFAAATAVAANMAACAAFGLPTLGAFVHSLGDATQSHLTVAGLGWSKLQSVYGLVRAAGLSGRAAWIVQGVTTATLALGIVAAWRSRLSFELRAALLAISALLATPYVFVYDLPVLSVAVALLARARRFDRLETWLLASTVPSIFGFLWLPVPTALFATLAIGAIAVRRAFAERGVLADVFSIGTACEARPAHQSAVVDLRS